jgi:predicted glycoside hydrolase/deacetylase ChbG (UPF0249 family)
MIIVNADDWGGWASATDAARDCYLAGRISSTSAMVFMADSQRGAEEALRVGIPVGLHLNLNQDLSGPECPPSVKSQHSRIHRFLKRSRYALILYHPFLRRAFRETFKAQYDEFVRLYNRRPTHIDGHRHMHLCSNVLLSSILPADLPIRRSFSFWPGEKSGINRMYRRAVDRRLTRIHRTTRYFFALSQCMSKARFARVIDLSRSANVELMTHPEVPAERSFLMSNEYQSALSTLQVASYANL